MNGPEEADLENSIPVVEWFVRRAAVLHDDGASEVTLIEMRDASSSEEFTIAMDPSSASWLAWALLGVAGSLMESYGIVSQDDD